MEKEIKLHRQIRSWSEESCGGGGGKGIEKNNNPSAGEKRSKIKKYCKYAIKLNEYIWKNEIFLRR